MPCKMQYEITYPFTNFNGSSVEVLEWTIKNNQHIIMDVITYPAFEN